MKKIQIISMIVLLITVIIMGVNMFISPLSDWIVRIDGIILLIALLLVSFSTVRIYKDK